MKGKSQRCKHMIRVVFPVDQRRQWPTGERCAECHKVRYRIPAADEWSQWGNPSPILHAEPGDE